MRISDFAVNRPVAVLMAVCAIVLLGAVSLSSLTIDLFPEMNFPVAIVATDYTGAAPQEVENLVTRPLEEVLGTVENVKDIESLSQVGSSLIIVEFEWGTDMDFATLEMREKIDLVESYLPEDTSDPLVVQMDPNMMPVIQLSVTGDLSPEKLTSLADDVISPRLERLEGVASVEPLGFVERQIQVRVEPEKLVNFGLSLPQVVQALQAENLSLSGGQVEKGKQELLVRVTGDFDSAKQVEEVPIYSPTGAVVKVKDIAQVVDGFKEQRMYARTNGKPSIGLAVRKQTTANTVSVVRNVREELETLKDLLPQGVEIATVMDQAKYIERSISNMVKNTIFGGILATIVLYVFLRNFRSTLVIALAMPISIIATFTMVYFSGLTLNLMSMGGLALGIGMMVDSAIVILENIYRHRQEGMSRIDAAKFGASEVTNAITASTFTTISVFFPIVFVQGLASQLFTQLALSVSFSLVASLLVALTLIPMLSSKMLKVNYFSHENGTLINGTDGGRNRLLKATGRWLGTLNRSYPKLLSWALSHRKAVVLIVTAATIGSLALIPVIGAEFIPSMDQSMMAVDVKLPNGALLEETEKIVAQVEEFVEELPEVETIFTSVGSATGNLGGGVSVGGTENGRIDITLKPVNQRKRSTDQIVELVRKKVQTIPGAEFDVSSTDSFMGPGMFMAPIELVIRGDDLDVLDELARTVAERVKKVPGTREVKTSLEEGRPEVQVVIDRDKANLYGLSAAQIASVTRTAIQGQVATRYRTGGEEIDVLVRLDQQSRKNLQDLENVMIPSPAGYQVPLREVADLVITKAPNTIERRGQVRTVAVTSQLSGRSLGQVMKDIKASLEDLPLPQGYMLEYGGESKEMREAFGDLTMALLLAIALVYMILAAQFESLLHPLAIMFSMPVTIIGVVVGLVVTGRTFSVTTFIGVIMLAGIVVNNAIVLVDYINTLRRRGMERREAILQAGPTRLRPILMTALTTILAMVPLALGLGEGAEAQAPMATAVIGGLAFSTLLTLVFVPVMYTILEDLGQKVKGILVRKAKNGQSVEVTLK